VYSSHLTATKIVETSTNKIADAITTEKFMKYSVEYQVKTDTKWCAYICMSKADVPLMMIAIKNESTINQAHVCCSAHM
jgi:hypothetical protein